MSPQSFGVLAKPCRASGKLLAWLQDVSVRCPHKTPGPLCFCQDTDKRYSSYYGPYSTITILRFRAQRATLHACQNQRSFDLPLQLLLTLHSVRPCTPGSGGCSYANLDLIVFVATGLDITSKDLSGTCIWNNPLQMGNPLTASVQHLYIVVLDVVTALFLAASCVRFSRTGAVVLNPKPQTLNPKPTRPLPLKTQPLTQDRFKARSLSENFKGSFLKGTPKGILKEVPKGTRDLNPQPYAPGAEVPKI